MSKKNKKKNKEFLDKKTLTQLIIEIFSQNPTADFNYKQVAKRLNIKDPNSRQLITGILYELKEKELLNEISTGKFKLAGKSGYVIGRVDMTNSGFAYVVSEKMSEEVFVSQENLHHALNGDLVKVYLFARRKRRMLEGEVTEILDRAKKTFVGTVEISKNFAFLIIETKGMPYDLFIPLEKLNGAKDGQKAVAKITDWPKKAKNPFGEIVEVLGDPGVHETEIHAILAEFELPYHFPEDVAREAESLGVTIPEEEIKKRRDFRKITTLTIDPEDAKDFDDALSLRKLKNGNWEVGVHIADVTHYVKPKTLLDSEAFTRGTSVYLVDRVVPMLPEKLSNLVCSLRPGEEKLCYSAVFEMNDQAEVLGTWFGKTIILSDKRFTYEEAQQIIETGVGELEVEILQLHELAQILRKNRFQNGAIDFDRIEVKFNIDEAGRPLGVFFKQQKEANQLIEEFMLLANKSVAEFVGQQKSQNKNQVFVYRIHDKPNKDKLDAFAQIAKRFGYKLNLGSNKKLSSSLNKMLEEVKGKKEQNLIETLALRSMAKAIYSSNNIGHYGLSFTEYTHFTSPIRRYPDILSHRLLTQVLGNMDTQGKKILEKQCKHCSEMEQRAVDAERASIKFKQVEFMKDKVGQSFDGVISGVTSYGIFVEIIENKCEGLVSIHELNDDFYEYDEDNYQLRGRHHGNIYQLGDNVKIQLVKANLVKKQLDFILAEK